MRTGDGYNPDVITPIVPKNRWLILEDEELDLLVQATLEILESVGVHFPSPRALEILAEHGAKVDFESQIVCLPPDLVESALPNAPRTFNLGGRGPEYGFHLREGYSFYGTSGTMAFVVDMHSREKRAATKDDVARMARAANHLDPVAFYWPMGSAGDYGKNAPLHEVHASFLNCRKHVQTETVMGEVPARYAVEMAMAVCGDADTLRQAPPLSALICCIDPLGQDPHGLETALVFAEAGLPVGFMAMNTMMSTGPATPAAALAVGNAEVVSALVMVQLAFPEASVFHAIEPAVMEPYTAGYLFDTPLTSALFGSAIELAHAQGLPALGATSNTDAVEIGWQAGKERLGFVSALVGAEMVVGLGGMTSVSTVYPEKLILDCDLFLDDRATLTGFEVTREALALDVMRDVGPRGNYLMEPHTLQHMREIPLSDLVMESRRQGREGAGGVIETAREKIKWIIEHHEPEPLDRAVQVELDQIVAAADREIKAA